MGQWDNGTMGQWDNGTMGQWDNGTMAAREERGNLFVLLSHPPTIF